MSKLQKWREDYQKLRETAEKLECFAIERNLPIGFEVRWQWPALDWIEWGSGMSDQPEHVNGSIPRFREMCALTTAALGAPPEKCESRHWIGPYTDAIPDLIAEWNIAGVHVVVRVLSPKGCKLDPRVEFIAAQETRIHPECKAALVELEEELALSAPRQPASPKETQ